MNVQYIRHCFSTFQKRKRYGNVIITPAGRDELWLIEGNHKINIFAELSHGDIDRVIVRDSLMAWEPPFDKEVISIRKKEWMIGLICKYLEDIGETYIIE